MESHSEKSSRRASSPSVVIPRRHPGLRVRDEPTTDSDRGRPLVNLQNRSATGPTTAPSEDTDYPRSRDTRWKHSMPLTQEDRALEKLKITWKATDHDSPKYEGYVMQKPFMTVDLNDFEIYISPKQPRFPHELVSLEYLDVRGKQLLCDGILSIGGSKHYVQGVQLKVYSIEGYGEIDSADSVVYVQSEQANHDFQFDIWYRLGKPSDRYEQFHTVFAWTATLGKHVIDFLESQENGAQVGLVAFRHDFHAWLIRRFSNDEAKADLDRWLKAFGGTDFRRSVHAHIDYLRQEAYNLHNSKALLKHPLWADCMRHDHNSITPQPVVCENTTTTPHVYQCFKNRYFAKFLNQVQPCYGLREAQEQRKRLLGFPCGPLPRESASDDVTYSNKVTQFRAGDVISILPDEVEERMWRKETNEASLQDEWYAYVRKTEPWGSKQRLFVIWLYRPSDTTIATTDYPVHKELFMSDHCNCDEAELLSNEVARRCSVEWFSTAMDTPRDFLVRQKYNTRDSSFVSLRKSDFTCTCSQDSERRNLDLKPGDTVYIKYSRGGEDVLPLGGEEILEPVVVVNFDPGSPRITVRKLLRLQRDCSEMPGAASQDAADNELVWTDKVDILSLHRIDRRCHIRYFSRDDIASQRVPFPYNKGGAGDFWILSSRTIILHIMTCIEALTKPPPGLTQGPRLGSMDKTVTGMLKGLSLFSGCGNLDAGLEQGGAVEFETAVEMCPEAAHTLHANATDPDKMKLWLGSVDDYLHDMLSGRNSRLIARLGNVGVIAAGSPCPGFSTLQKNWRSDGSLRNASHVTTFCSFLDIYRPKYAFLENVVNMACTRPGFEKELVLSQIIACLVSMGYQVQQFIMSGWSYGSPQRRSRLILSVAAPGLAPLEPPPHTHSHPDDYRCRSIGELVNGQKYGVQNDRPTPFPHITAGKATSHLPNIGTGIVNGCVPYPDHRLCRPLNLKERSIIKYIPKDPPCQGLLIADRLGLVPRALYKEKKELGNSYKRVKKDGLFPVAITKPSPHDTRAGAVVHWSEDRALSIEEFRIAQGFPPDFVLIGSVAEQMRMVGNAVDRRVSEILGIKLRFAVRASSPDTLHADYISLDGIMQNDSRRRSSSLLCVRIPRQPPRLVPIPRLINCDSSSDSDTDERWYRTTLSPRIDQDRAHGRVSRGTSKPMKAVDLLTSNRSYSASRVVEETPEPFSPSDSGGQHQSNAIPALSGDMDLIDLDSVGSSDEQEADPSPSMHDNMDLMDLDSDEDEQGPANATRASPLRDPKHVLQQMCQSFAQGDETSRPCSMPPTLQVPTTTNKRAHTQGPEPDKLQHPHKRPAKWAPVSAPPQSSFPPTLGHSLADYESKLPPEPMPEPKRSIESAQPLEEFLAETSLNRRDLANKSSSKMSGREWAISVRAQLSKRAKEETRLSRLWKLEREAEERRMKEQESRKGTE